MIAGSEVYFASWAIDALAARIDTGPELREWVAPRRVPFVRQSGTDVTVPGRPRQALAEEARAVLALCDGVRPAREIRAALPDVDVSAALADLVARRWVVWKLEVPAGARPERYLRAWLDRVGDAELRAPGLAALDALERGRDRVAEAAGPEALVTALTDLEGEFVALTETAAVREKAAGTAPCRALVYSDCRRAATATLGRTVHEALAPLDPLLTSAGWLTARLADAVMGRARRCTAGWPRRGRSTWPRSGSPACRSCTAPPVRNPPSSSRSSAGAGTRSWRRRRAPAGSGCRWRPSRGPSPSSSAARAAAGPPPATSAPTS